jgi:hypothetical protein
MAGVHGIMLAANFQHMLASGGTTFDFTDGDGVTWRVHVFNDGAAFSVSRLGSLRGYVQRLVVGGGGGGGWQNFKPSAGACGGGGAGDHRGGGDGTDADDYG